MTERGREGGDGRAAMREGLEEAQGGGRREHEREWRYRNALREGIEGGR